MKKALALLLSTTALLLVACGGNPSASSQGSSASRHDEQSSSVSSALPSDTSSTTEVQVSETVFETTVTDVVDVLSDSMEGKAGTLPRDITPEESTWDAVGNIVSGTYYHFRLSDATGLSIIDSGASGKVQKISLIANIDKLTNETAGELGTYLFNLVAMFEPDSETLPEVNAELDIANTGLSEPSIKFAEGTIAAYTYSVLDDLIMLEIAPK